MNGNVSAAAAGRHHGAGTEAAHAASGGHRGTGPQRHRHRRRRRQRVDGAEGTPGTSWRAPATHPGWPAPRSGTGSRPGQGPDAPGRPHVRRRAERRRRRHRRRCGPGAGRRLRRREGQARRPPRPSPARRGPRPRPSPGRARSGRLGRRGAGAEWHRHRRCRGQGVDRAEGSGLHRLGHRRLVAGRAHHHPAPGGHHGPGQAAAGIAHERRRAGRSTPTSPRATWSSCSAPTTKASRGRPPTATCPSPPPRLPSPRRRRSPSTTTPTADSHRLLRGDRFAGSRPVPLPWAR